MKFLFLTAFLNIFCQFSHCNSAFASACSEALIGIRAPEVILDERVQISDQELLQRLETKIKLVPEFEFIRKTADQMNLRVWLFGGTAAGFLHYVKWDFMREHGASEFQPDRFDYDFTNIFRSTQDLDIVADGSAEVSKRFRDTLALMYPHFLGSKANKWEVRTLRYPVGKPGEIGYKEALLSDDDFNNQNSDSNSIGMVEITHRTGDSRVRDLKNWNSKSFFLTDAVANKITFLRNQKHFTTARARLGENPEILSVIRFLVKAFQYELQISREDRDAIQQIVDHFNPGEIKNEVAKRKIDETSKKLVMHAVNIEYAIKTLDELGLRKKLISMGRSGSVSSMSWWLNREPLPSFEVGKGIGKTAEELGITVVSHETNNFLSYESITRAHSGAPNVLKSRRDNPGESASEGDGYYTMPGRKGGTGSGLTIRFRVNPKAREGTDFKKGHAIIFFNKNALTVIQESLVLNVNELLELALFNSSTLPDRADLALIEKLKRRITPGRLTEELKNLLDSIKSTDHEKLIGILRSFRNSIATSLFPKETIESIAKIIYQRISSIADGSDEEVIQYIRMIDSVLPTLESLSLIKNFDFFEYLRNIVKNNGRSLEVRKTALFEMLVNWDDSFGQFTSPGGKYALFIQQEFSDLELSSIRSELFDRNSTGDLRRNNITQRAYKRWSDAIKRSSISKIESLIQSGFYTLDQKSAGGFSMLLLADYYRQPNIIDWLINNPNYNFNERNKEGFTDVEQLRLLGRAEVADQIEAKRPEARSRNFKLLERHENKSPIVDFVRFEPGTFLMGESEPQQDFSTRARRVFVTLTRPFSILSTHVAEYQWQGIIEILRDRFKGRYIDLYLIDNLTLEPKKPVTNVSSDQVQRWLSGLNELASSDDPEVIEAVRNLLPGFISGKKYRLPTEAEREYVTRNGGLAEGKFSFGNKPKDVSIYSWWKGNSAGFMHKVGKKKPIFHNGQPLYDIQGNAFEWVTDHYASPLPGGVDPNVPATAGIDQVVRGGSYQYEANKMRAAYRSYVSAGGPKASSSISFRIVRED